MWRVVPAISSSVIGSDADDGDDGGGGAGEVTCCALRCYTIVGKNDITTVLCQLILKN